MPAENTWVQYVISTLVETCGYDEAKEIIDIMNERNPESNEVAMTVRALKETFAAYPVPTPQH